MLWELLALITVFLGCSPRQQEEDSTLPSVVEARQFLAEQPTHLRPFPHTEVPDGLPDMYASTCGGCHTEFYDEWRISTHAHAWDNDPQFMAELEKSREGGQDVSWMCVNCHTPLENQLPQLVGGLRDGALNQPIYIENPSFDERLQHEAITCAACHVKGGVVLGPWGNTDAPHPVAKGEMLLTSDVCTECHQANVRLPDINLACMFNTGDEFANSDWADGDTQCQDCHMPEIRRPLVPGAQERNTRRHWFGGSLIPKKPEFSSEISELSDHFSHGMTVEWDPPASLSVGANTTLNISIENTNAGHYLPTGDPERFILVEISIFDDQGRILQSHTERIGAHYQWSPEVKLISDNRLAPRERRGITVTFTTPQTDNIGIKILASKFRISKENLEFHNLEGKTVAGIPFHMNDVQIPVTQP